jgi:hypothetical protein
MNEAARAQMMLVIDDMLGLVELDIRDGTDTEWLGQIDSVVQRADGSFEDLVRLMSKWAAIATRSLAEATGTPIDQALSDARVALARYVEAS